MNDTQEITNDQDVIDSRDIIARIEYLEELEQAVADADTARDSALDDDLPDLEDAYESAKDDFDTDLQEELKQLRAVADEGSGLQGAPNNSATWKTIWDPTYLYILVYVLHIFYQKEA